MNTMSYSSARAHLSSTMDRVVNDHEAVIITRGRRPPVVMLSLADYQAMEETAYLLRNPHNTRHLLQSIDQIRSGQVITKTMDELHALSQ